MGGSGSVWEAHPRIASGWPNNRPESGSNVPVLHGELYALLLALDFILADKGGSSPPRGPDGLQPTERWTEPDFTTPFDH